MNGKATAEQKRWQGLQRSRGCIINDGMGYTATSIHHISGSRAKLKGVKCFGEWYTICLSYWWHQDGRNASARHINKKQFELMTSKTEKEWFIKSVEEYIDAFGHPPMSVEEYQIIKDRA